MQSRADARIRWMSDVAPLTEPLAWHLATARMKALPRPAGRPSREAGDANTREARLILAALRQMIPEIVSEQQQVFALMDPIVSAGKLTRKWLLDQLSKYVPDNQLVYPDRLREWHRDNLLLYTEQGQLEPQSTAAILVMRRLDHRQKGWLPRQLPTPRSFFCWRRDASNLEAVPYELPLVSIEGHPSVVKPSPATGPAPYVLWTTWKGAAWRDDAWLVYDTGAIRWVGNPSEEELAQWLSPQAMATLAVPASRKDLAKQALAILATDSLVHRSTYNGSVTTD